MTDATTAPEDTGWDDEPREDQSAPVVYPERTANPHNHKYTLSLTPKEPPFLVIRAETDQELKDILTGLQEDGAMAVIGDTWSAYKAQLAVGAGLGPASPVPPQAGPQGGFPPGTGPAYNPQTPPPGVPGQAPAPWQNAGAPAPQPGAWQPPPAAPQGGGQGNRGPKPRPNWPQVYKITVPFPRKDEFKAYREQYKDAFKGKVLWAGAGDYWVDGSVAQAFAGYSPVQA